MIDLEQQFEQAWAGEPLLPDPASHLAAGRRRLRRRRILTSVAASTSVVAVVAVVAGLSIGGVTTRGAEVATSSPNAGGSQNSQIPVRAWDDPDVQASPLWTDDHQIYRSAEDVEILRVDDSRLILDATTGKTVGHEVVYETRWRGRSQAQYFDYAAGRYRGDGGGAGGYDALVAHSDIPLFYDHGPDYFEVFASPVGVDESGLTAKTGAQILSQRVAEPGEYSTRRFDAGAPSVGVATIAGLRYYAVAGYRSDLHDVIYAEQAQGRTLEQFLAEVKQGMDDGSIEG